MNGERPTLAARQGPPVSDNQSLRSVGERGPATLKNYQFIEKITHLKARALSPLSGKPVPHQQGAPSVYSSCQPADPAPSM
jgi:catalase